MNGKAQNVEDLLSYVDKTSFKTTSSVNFPSLQKNLLILTVFGRRPNLEGKSPKIVADLKKKGVEIVILAIDSDPELFKAICPPSNIVSIDGSDQLPDVVGLLEEKTRKTLGKKDCLLQYISALIIARHVS